MWALLRSNRPAHTTYPTQGQSNSSWAPARPSGGVRARRLPPTPPIPPHLPTVDLPTSYIINASDVIAAAPHYGPYISLFSVPLSAFSAGAAAAPLADFLAFKPWAEASIETVTTFSAECYLTALNLFEGIKGVEGRGVAVGAVMSDWPGASITQLSSPAAMEVSCNGGASSSGVGGAFPGPIPGPGAPSSQWNTMISPLTVGPLVVCVF